MPKNHLFTKLAAATLVAGLAASFAVLGAPAAHAATVTKSVKLSCRTNGAPMKYNVTRPMNADIVITTPDNVKAGENTVVRVQYVPELTPGKESIATMKQLKDIVVRFTLDDPSAFVTAQAVGPGKFMMNPATVSLVGGNMLVMSGMNAAVNGKDTAWQPPALDITMKAPKDGNVLKTVHLTVEGPSGEFNNPANAMTMKTVTDSILGELTIQLNCQAQSGPETYATVPVVNSGTNAPGSQPALGKPGASGKANSASNATGHGKKGPNSAQQNGSVTNNESSPTVATDANGLQRVDQDIYAEEFKGGGTPGWLIAVIVIVCLAAAGGIGYGIYYGVKKKGKQKR